MFAFSTDAITADDFVGDAYVRVYGVQAMEKLGNAQPGAAQKILDFFNSYLTLMKHFHPPEAQWHSVSLPQSIEDVPQPPPSP